jgi:tRNA-uridine 2-sulfurtransferase
MKLAVGLSGGVDSSVAAAILKQQGHTIVGVTMKIWQDAYKTKVVRSACFGPDEAEDIEDAAAVAKKIGIPFRVIDLSEEYHREIIGYFKGEYLDGRTPNPCVKCNKQLKFGYLVDEARASGLEFDYFATGHYARIGYDEKAKRYLLKKATYLKKDQSYFLVLLSQEQLAQIKFPLGNYTKEEVRAMAKKVGLATSEKKESQDFYAGDYNDLLDTLPPQGEIVNRDGQVLGKHKGICHYTIGQRKGLGIAYPTPLYVVEIDKKNNKIIAGAEKELYASELIVSNINWIAIDKLSEPRELKVKIRYLHQEAAAKVTPLNETTVKVEFKEPQKAITPGQIAAFYQDDIVVGGGVIN